MHLHFETQAKYKDEKRKDLRETLEIQVSDGAGLRDYEMFSGGEAFRVNFAIRLALSEVLAQRKGARLQMLVIDEGFGSQDALGPPAPDPGHQRRQGGFCQDPGHHPPGRTEGCLPRPHRGGEDLHGFDSQDFITGCGFLRGIIQFR